jgi:hypothetical protein
MTYEQDAYSQIEDWDWDENAVNINRVFSAAERDDAVTIYASQWLWWEVSNPQDGNRVSARIREINSPRRSTEVLLPERFTDGGWFLARLTK